MRRTKIVCTIGPASSSDKMLEGLIRAGMNVARLNFSHGDHPSHRRVIRKIRQLERKLGKPIAILQDLPGPKIRIGAVAGDRVRLPTRRPFVLTTKKILGSESAVSVSFPGLTRAVKKGDPILLGDGEIELEALQVGDHEVKCRIIVGGILGSHKGIHFPRTSLNIRALTHADKKDLAFGIANDVDMIALSFVRNSQDILYARREMQKRGAKIPIIAKIEKHEALDNLDGILKNVDGIMVARGDLGLEIAQQRIPAMQKMMIRDANHLGKPVITATQMLRSMVDSPLPTRAEATDVANAVLDGTDAVMLSEETAVGRFPLEAVRLMGRIVDQAETLLPAVAREASNEVAALMAQAACVTAERVQARAIVVPTRSGSTARRVARHRPRVPIIALTPDETVRRRLSLVWGVTPLTIAWFTDTDALLGGFRDPVRRTGLVPEGAPVVLTAGWPISRPGITNLVHVTTF